MSTLTFINHDFPGSELYYSLARTYPVETDPIRQAILAVHYFYKELRSIISRSTEPTILQQKLSWWQSELDRAWQGQAQHPLAKALYTASRQFNFPEHLLQASLECHLQEIEPCLFSTDKEVLSYAHRTSSILFILTSYIVNSHSTQELQFARDIGVSFHLLQTIERLPVDLAHNRCYFSQQNLQAAKLNAAQLKQILKTNSGPNEALISLCQNHLTTAEKYYQDALATLDKPMRFKQLVNILSLEILFAKITKFKKHNFDPRRYPIDLSPLRKLWLSRSKLNKIMNI